MATTYERDNSPPVITPVPDERTRPLTIGTSALYLSLYLHYGFFAFIPLWLSANGSSAAEIGVLLAIPLILRLLTVAPFTAWCGKRGRVRDAITVTALLSAALILFLVGKPDHIGRVAIILAFSIAWDQLPVLTDAYAVMAVRSHGVDFGRVRVWGSLAAVISTGTAGWAIGLIGIDALPVVIAALLLLPAVTAPWLPSDRTMSAAEAGARASWRDVMRDRTLLRALIASALIMASHGVITSFGAIQWSARGISTGVIGTLQAVAVSVEIVAFVLGGKALGKRDPMLLIWIASAVAIVRWGIMALDPGQWVIVGAQLLHGITSTGAILGVMMMIARRVPVQAAGAAQGLNAVLVGVGLAAITGGSGLLWARGVSLAYLAMAGIAALAMIVAWPRRSSAPPDA